PFVSFLRNLGITSAYRASSSGCRRSRRRQPHLGAPRFLKPGAPIGQPGAADAEGVVEAGDRGTDPPERLGGAAGGARPLAGPGAVGPPALPSEIGPRPLLSIPSQGDGGRRLLLPRRAGPGRAAPCPDGRGDAAPARQPPARRPDAPAGGAAGRGDATAARPAEPGGSAGGELAARLSRGQRGPPDDTRLCRGAAGLDR